MKNERIRLSLLCDIYGSLLSEKQRNALDLYCNEDLSLSETAENTGISRQGVRDQLTHAETQLTFYEDALGLLAKNTAVSALDVYKRQGDGSVLRHLRKGRKAGSLSPPFGICA